MKPYRWALPFLFALLFLASFHPLNFAFLAWVALVPLVVYAKTTTGKTPILVAWTAGFLAYGIAFSWSHYTVPFVGPMFLGAYKGLYVALFVLILRKLAVEWAPVAWVGLEYVRSHLFGGLPWFLVGSSQHEMIWLIQIADLGGVWLVSALVAFVNAALLTKCRIYRWAAVGSLAAAFAYGGIRLQTIEMEDGPVLAIIQPNIPQDLKKKSTEEIAQARKNYQEHVKLTLEIADRNPALVVWPEASLYYALAWDLEKRQWVKGAWYEHVAYPANRTGIPTMMGLLVAERDPDRNVTYTNSALVMEPGAGVTHRFDKVHLVPFAEFVPLAKTFPWIRDAIHSFSGLFLQDMRPGEGYPLWELEGRRYAPQICFEAIFPEISRDIAGNGGEFTVNISNDGWFEDSAELDQMLAMSRFRAIENRIGFVRATNTGISAFIEPTGRLSAVLEKDGRRKEVKGTLVAPVKVTDSGSLFRILGGWVPWLALGGLAGGLIRRFFVDTRKRRE